jgi:hypothetical protein
MQAVPKKLMPTSELPKTYTPKNNNTAENKSNQTLPA